VAVSVPRAAVYDIRTDAAGKGVVARHAIELIVSIGAEDDVVARAARRVSAALPPVRRSS
jgi:hypothetical protein